MADPHTGNIERNVAESEHIGPDWTGDNINAKRIAGYKYDVGSDSWIRDGVALAERYDVQGNTIYVGEAVIGTSTSSATWTITKYDLADLTNASGLIATALAWDDRATGVYA